MYSIIGVIAAILWIIIGMIRDIKSGKADWYTERILIWGYIAATFAMAGVVLDK